VQLAPAAMLHPIIKPWPFCGWALDFVGQIHPASSKGHRFVLAAIDCFTKRTEHVTLKNMTYREVIVTPPSRNDGVNQDHIEGFSAKRGFTTPCI
jgi:hypothetical protein